MAPLARSILLLFSSAASEYLTYTTDGWLKYPGYAGTQSVTGALEIAAGPTDSDLTLQGTLSNLPTGSGNGLHLHEGFDVLEEATVGGHYHPGLKVDPWSQVTYAGPTDAINVTVLGVPWRESLGRVVVIHDSSGARVAIAKVVPKVAAGTAYYSAELSSYPMYSSLAASIQEYAGGSSGISGTVRVLEAAASSGSSAAPKFRFVQALAGLPSDASQFVIALHSNADGTACDSSSHGQEHTRLLVHVAAPGSLYFELPNVSLGELESCAVVIRQRDGMGLGCGLLHSSAKGTVGAYPGYATNSAVGGLVWVAQGGGASDPLFVSYKLSNLPSGETSGGLHIHDGKTCASASTIGGHFWTPATSPDPWTAGAGTMWTKANGTTTATGRFSVVSGYSLHENADHAIVIHASDGTRIGCATLQYYPTARGYAVLTASTIGGGGLELSGNLGGTMFERGAAGGIHVHAGTSCSSAEGPESPQGHLLNTDGSDPWSTTYSVGGHVTKPVGGQDYGHSSRLSGEANIRVGVTGDQQTLAVATGKTVVAHSSNGGRIACGIVRSSVGADSFAGVHGTGAISGGRRAPLFSICSAALAFAAALLPSLGA